MRLTLKLVSLLAADICSSHAVGQRSGRAVDEWNSSSFEDSGIRNGNWSVIATAQDGGVEPTLGENIPDEFHLQIKPKKEGKIFLDKYQCYQTVIDCAVRAAMSPWTSSVAAFKCQESHADIGLAFTSNKPPQPTFEIRSILWSLRYLYSWSINESVGVTPVWQELSALAFSDPNSRLGIMQMYAVKKSLSAQSAGTHDGQGFVNASALSSNTSHTSISTENVTAILDIAKEESVEGILQVGLINVRLKMNKDSRPICKDTEFWTAILMTIVALAQEDAQSAIKMGLMKHFTDGDFTFGVQATSLEAGAEDVFKVFIALKALQILSWQIARAKVNERFKKFEGTIITGARDGGPRGSRIVGKILFLPGNRIVRPDLESQGRDFEVVEEVS